MTVGNVNQYRIDMISIQYSTVHRDWTHAILVDQIQSKWQTAKEMDKKILLMYVFTWQNGYCLGLVFVHNYGQQYSTFKPMK